MNQEQLAVLKSKVKTRLDKYGEDGEGDSSEDSSKSIVFDEKPKLLPQPKTVTVTERPKLDYSQQREDSHEQSYSVVSGHR